MLPARRLPSLAVALVAESKIEQRFGSSQGLGGDRHDHRLFEGTERFFRPNDVGNLVSNWIPALDGVEAKRKAGATAADAGCGFGTSTNLA